MELNEKWQADYERSIANDMKLSYHGYDKQKTIVRINCQIRN
jgi:hypothetical protein